VAVAIFLVAKLFTSNPLEGRWVDENTGLKLRVKGNGYITVTIPELYEDTNVSVEVIYTLDKEEKTITIRTQTDELKKTADKSQGKYNTAAVASAISSVTDTFEYSVTNDIMTLTPRDYGDTIIFTKP
jgi:hypothetical protein